MLIYFNVYAVYVNLTKSILIIIELKQKGFFVRPYDNSDTHI